METCTILAIEIGIILSLILGYQIKSWYNSWKEMKDFTEYLERDRKRRLDRRMKILEDATYKLMRESPDFCELLIKSLMKNKEYERR